MGDTGGWGGRGDGGGEFYVTITARI
jgi:hypothetical protein